MIGRKRWAIGELDSPPFPFVGVFVHLETRLRLVLQLPDLKRMCRGRTAGPYHQVCDPRRMLLGPGHHGEEGVGLYVFSSRHARAKPLHGVELKELRRKCKPSGTRTQTWVLPDSNFHSKLNSKISFNLLHTSTILLF